MTKLGLSTITIAGIFFMFTICGGTEAASSDAIAIRIMPNPNHYSPMRWYKENIKSKGAPQSLLVDGYEAIRDGRTVYVNAANIVDANNFHTNIYLISFNQEPEKATEDIFGQILSHWKFNSNVGIIFSGGEEGRCNIGTAYCGDSVPCADNENCDENNRCVAAAKACIADVDCPSGTFCSGPKAAVIRDVKRLANIADVKTALENHKSKNNKYSILQSGTYLPNKTVSTWPSWQETLGKELGITMPADPINRLGKCRADDNENNNFNPETCWNDKSKQFATSFPELATGSLAMVYWADTVAKGDKYNICAVMESGLVSDVASGACPGSMKEFKGIIENMPPFFSGVNLGKGYSGYKYEGFVAAKDPEGSSLKWKVVRLTYQHEAITSVWSSWNDSVGQNVNLASLSAFLNSFGSDPNLKWDDAKIIAETGVPRQRKIYAKTIGKPGNYTFKISVDDGNGTPNSITTEDFHIVVEDPTVKFAPIAPQEIIIGKKLDFTMKAQADDGHYPAHPVSFSISGDTPDLPISCATSISADPAEEYKSYCRISKNNIEVNTKEYFYHVIGTDFYDQASMPVDFSVKVKNNPPQITTVSLPEATGCVDYGPVTIDAFDPDDGHSIVGFSAEGLPDGLAINNSGIISGTPNVLAGIFHATIKVWDQYHNQTLSPYSAIGSKNLDLEVKDKVFSVDLDKEEDTIYAMPSGNPHHSPSNGDKATYFGEASANISPVTYEISGQTGLFTTNTVGNKFKIHANSYSNSDAGDYTATVKAKNSCGVYGGNEKTITLHVLKNEWCGDGEVQNGAAGTHNHNEQCDDGNTNNGDGCSSTCQWETRTFNCQESWKPANAEWTRSSYGQTCIQSDGANCTSWNPDNSSSASMNENPPASGCFYKCSGGFTWDSANNRCGKCGDNFENTGEECDNGSYNGQSCTPPYGGTCPYCDTTCHDQSAQGGACGNGGTPEGPEQCDNGAANTNTPPACSVYNANMNLAKCPYCTASCTSQSSQGPYCGDENPDAGHEACDLGSLNGISCPGTYGVQCYQCDSTCQNEAWVYPRCGDGVCDHGETSCTCPLDCGNPADTDGDSIDDCHDTCPDVSNYNDGDVDGDGVGDLCDLCYNYPAPSSPCVKLKITQPGTNFPEYTFYPYVAATSAENFYNYIPPSSQVAEKYSITKVNRSEIFAYVDKTSNKLYLGFIHDKPITGNGGGKIKFSFPIEGAYKKIVASDLVVKDDATDWSSCAENCNTAYTSCLTSPWPYFCDTTKETCLSSCKVDTLWKNDDNYITDWLWKWDSPNTDGGMIYMGTLNESSSIKIDPVVWQLGTPSGTGTNKWGEGWFVKIPGGVEVGTSIPVNQGGSDGIPAVIINYTYTPN